MHEPVSPGTTLLAMSAPARIAAALGGVGGAVARRLVGAVTAALRLVDLTVSYDRHPAVHHVSAEIPAAEMTAIVGPNGAGKSTLLKALLGPGAAHRRPHRMHGQAHRLPAAAGRDRPLLPDLGVRHGAARPLVALRRLRRGQARRHPRRPARHRSGRACGLRAPADRHALGRPVPARAVRPRCCCRTPISSCWTSRLPPSIPRPSPTSWR